MSSRKQPNSKHVLARAVDVPEPDVPSRSGQEWALVAPCCAQSLARNSCGKVALEHK